MKIPYRVAAFAAAGTFIFSTAAGIASIGGASFLSPAETTVTAAEVPGWASDVVFASAGLCAVMMVVGESREGVTDIVDVTLGASQSVEVSAGHSVACGTGIGEERPFGAHLSELVLAKGDLAAL
ncbi:hypothetical protein [Chthonobacter rhizosphaerae]|uniref:hypothetical protein n=1 Tax=Chthonobacter rhizosphaerae TaxID=2735553 RepID=UPI0015EE5F89|nr:hypothetical protein [Chthonobacter rhizosphaerae]